jgi:hypothetical protein
MVRRLYLNSEFATLASNGRYVLVVSEPVRCWREGLLIAELLAQIDGAVRVGWTADVKQLHLNHEKADA